MVDIVFKNTHEIFLPDDNYVDQQNDHKYSNEEKRNCFHQRTAVNQRFLFYFRENRQRLIPAKGVSGWKERLARATIWRRHKRCASKHLDDQHGILFSRKVPFLDSKPYILIIWREQVFSVVRTRHPGVNDVRRTGETPGEVFPCIYICIS